MTLQRRRKFVWLIPVFIIGIVFLVFSVQAQGEPPVLAVYLNPNGTVVFDNGSVLDFGETVVGTPVSRTLYVANLSTTEPITVNVGNILPGFSRSANSLTIGANSFSSLTIQCNATAVGLYNVSTYLDVANVGGAMDFNFTVSCTVREPLAVYLNPNGTVVFDNGSVLDFGETVVGTSVSRTLYVANLSTTESITVNVGDILPGFSRSANSLSIGAGSSRSLTIQCNATAVGPYNVSTYLDIVDGDQVQEFTFSVSCNVVRPRMAIYAPDGVTLIPEGGTYNFGTTLLGTPLEATFTIVNEGTGTLTSRGSTVGNFERVLGSFNPNLPLGPGQSTTFTLRCPADTAGTLTGFVSIDEVNDPDLAPDRDYDINLSCTVNPPAPEIAVYAPGGTEILNGGSYDFGTTPFGTPLEATFTIANEGTAALTWTNTEITVFEAVPPFSPGGSLQPGGNTTFTLRCPASSEGNHTGSVTIQGVNDTSLSGGSFSFNVSCTVTPPAPDIALYDGATPILVGSTVDFGTTTSGTPISRTFTIANEGAGTLNLGTIAVPTGFTLTSAPAASVGASTSTSFDVQCDASGEGTFGGTVSVPSDDPDENPYDFTVSCVVDTQPVTPTPTDTPASTPTPTTAPAAAFPTPPATNTCMDHNFVTNGGVRAGVSGELSGQVFCRVLVQDGDYTSYLGYDLTSASNIGNPALVELGIQQAVDIFSPTGPNYYQGGIVICLRGEGHLIYLNANRAPRIAEIVGSYTVPEFPGFTCITLFEPGTLLLVRSLPE